MFQGRSPSLETAVEEERHTLLLPEYLHIKLPERLHAARVSLKITLNEQAEGGQAYHNNAVGGGAHSLSHHLQRTPYISQDAYGSRGPDSQWKREESGESK